MARGREDIEAAKSLLGGAASQPDGGAGGDAPSPVVSLRRLLLGTAILVVAVVAAVLASDRAHTLAPVGSRPGVLGLLELPTLALPQLHLPWQAPVEAEPEPEFMPADQATTKPPPQPEPTAPPAPAPPDPNDPSPGYTDAREAQATAQGPTPMNFYMYRATGDAEYTFSNVNAADLEGVLWYLHNEVVTSAPRKYGIDRIRRYQVTVKNPQEFWNVHRKQFGPFFAYDAGKCTTKDGAENICDKIYRQYGFLVGCQPVSPGKAAYLTPYMQPPMWYSLPGPCPSMGIPQNSIDANMASQNVDKYKTAECKYKMPGGLCDKATGAPECTYSVWPAGEILLDELSGIQDYQNFWNTSYEHCFKEVRLGQRQGPCVKNMEYHEGMDSGVGNHFWDRRLDPAKCAERVNAALYLFSTKFPGVPTSVPTPICDFDSLYQGEFTWPVNHTGAVPSAFWSFWR